MVKKIQNILFLLAVSLLLLSFSNCGGAKTDGSKMSFEKNPPFQISEAYYQNWVAGIKEGGSGTHVHIDFSELDSTVVLQNIYFRNHILEARGNINQPNHFVGYLDKAAGNDVIMDADPIKEAQNTPPKNFPFQLQPDQAVLEYWYGGRKNYFKIPKLTQKQMLAYPEANPNPHE